MSNGRLSERDNQKVFITGSQGSGRYIWVEQVFKLSRLVKVESFKSDSSNFKYNTFGDRKPVEFT